jgi:hypothetical protein
MATMQTTSGLLTYLQQRLGLLGISLLLALALAVFIVVTGLLEASPEPVLVAPVRWS